MDGPALHHSSPLPPRLWRRGGLRAQRSIDALRSGEAGERAPLRARVRSRRHGAFARTRGRNHRVINSLYFCPFAGKFVPLGDVRPSATRRSGAGYRLHRLPSFGFFLAGRPTPGWYGCLSRISSNPTILLAVGNSTSNFSSHCADFGGGYAGSFSYRQMVFCG